MIVAAALAWQDRAACLGVDPDLFYPPQGPQEDGAAAKAVCARCSVRDECLDFAIANGERYGIWGGLSRDERIDLKLGRRSR